MSRQIVLDTETTGLEPAQGHRIIEIGCVELVNRKLTGKHFHYYINPERLVDEGAYAVHGISDDFLADKPVFAAIAEDFLSFIEGAELIIHNAPFDVGFINAEFNRHGKGFKTVADYCTVLDTLAMARYKHPGQKNNLDALCKRYDVDNSKRDLHGALLDAQILADVYLAMTGGQASLSLAADDPNPNTPTPDIQLKLDANRPPLPIIYATSEELAAHEAKLNAIDKSCGGQSVWRQLLAASGVQNP